MRKFIFIMLFIIPGILKAQQLDTSIVKTKEQYCMVLATEKLMSKKVNITVDYGQETKMFSFKDQRLKDEEGKVATFNSVIDALNYMASQDWRFVNAYVITVGSMNVYHYVMRREAVVAETSSN